MCNLLSSYRNRAVDIFILTVGLKRGQYESGLWDFFTPDFLSAAFNTAEASFNVAGSAGSSFLAICPPALAPPAALRFGGIYEIEKNTIRSWY